MVIHINGGNKIIIIGFHDSAVYVDPRCAIVSHQGKMMYGQLKIEEVMELQNKAIEAKQ